MNKKCPFRKNTQVITKEPHKYDAMIYHGLVTTKEEYEECYEKFCMAYKDEECLLIHKQF
jgi:hypothetical protein